MTKITKHFRKRENIALALRIYKLLSENSKKRIKAIVPIYVTLSLLDLLGVILLASCGTIAFNLVSGDTRPSRVELFIRQYLKVEIDSSTLIFTFAILAAVFLISKTILNAVVNYRMIKWMANQESVFSTNLFYYTVSEPAMSHIYSFACITAFVFYTKNYFLSFFILYKYIYSIDYKFNLIF